MKYSIMKKTAVFCTLFSVLVIIAVVYTMQHKIIVIDDVTNEDVFSEKAVIKEDAENKLEFQNTMQTTDYLTIPLDVSCKADSITIENHYMDKQLWIGLEGIPDDFYRNCPLSGDTSRIKGGIYERGKDITWLKMDIDGIYEYRSVLENDNLYMEFVPPREMYDKIVVIDAGNVAHNLEESTLEITENEIVSDIVKRLKEKIDKSDIKAYYTSIDNQQIAEEERINLANEMKADMFISVRTDADNKDHSVYGTKVLYNDTYFIPTFGSVELGDNLEREVVTSISGKAIGLEFNNEETVLQLAKIPSVVLETGYVTNSQESALLQKEDYRERIATGIFNAINVAYEEVPQ